MKNEAHRVAAEESMKESCDWFVNNATVPSWCCNTHMYDGTGDYPAADEHPDICPFAEEEEALSMADVYEMDESQFKEALAEKTTPESLFENAPDIYSYLTDVFEQGCEDSVLREWAFQWWVDLTGKSYDLIYERWLKHVDE